MEYRIIAEPNESERGQIEALLGHYDLAMPDLRLTQFMVGEEDGKILVVMCLKMMLHLEPVAAERSALNKIDWKNFYDMAEMYAQHYRLPEYMVVTPSPKIGQRLESYGMTPVKGTAYIKVTPW